MDDNDPPVKRRKLDTNLSEDVLAVREKQPSLRRGLDKPISPPLSKRKSPALQGHMLSPTWGFDDVPNKSYTMAPLSSEAQEHDIGGRDSPRTKSTLYVPSPFQLTHIQDLVPRQNVDSVQLKDILGDPMIKECWNFNFLFDLDFVM
jgi:tyrosyl-DNA phosphodiesterase-1